MTRNEFMEWATDETAQAIGKFRNCVMNIASRAWAEGRKAAEIEGISEIVKAALEQTRPADVQPAKEGKNITENNPVDEFVCSKCGIILEDWSRVEIDEDDGERTNHEYVFQFCPQCGADMTGGADNA